MAADGIYADLHFEGMFVLLICLISSPKKARDRATQLGYPEDQCVVQLFITGSLEDNPQSLISKWPKTCMVFATAALQAFVRTIR